MHGGDGVRGSVRGGAVVRRGHGDRSLAGTRGHATFQIGIGREHHWGIVFGGRRRGTQATRGSRRSARETGVPRGLLARFARVDVMVIDGFAIAPITDAERRDLLEILEDRHETRATIITSQIDPKHWHDYPTDPTTADAICDRVLHTAHRVALKGP